MELLALADAQKSLDHLLKCSQLRCVLDSFHDDLTKKSRESVATFLKDHGPYKVLRLCLNGEKPHRIAKDEVCFTIQDPKKNELQVLWRKQNGEWKMSNASQRPLDKKTPSEN